MARKLRSGAFRQVGDDMGAGAAGLDGLDQRPDMVCPPQRVASVPVPPRVAFLA